MVYPTEKSAVYNLANNVGISGFRHVVEPGVTTFRRLAWLIVILSASAWMLWNIHDRIAYFLQYPSSITTEIKFSNNLIFPKVTVCNQNVLRSSVIFKESSIPRRSPTLYEALDRYYQALLDHHGNNNKTFTEKVVNQYGHLLQTADIHTLYLRASHRKETLIERCTWKGQRCGPDNFTAVTTDLGQCYQFQPAHPDDLLVETTGHLGGLDLTLNVEQYDYMLGPRKAAGALVAVTEWNETEAAVQELGVTVTVGAATSLALRKTKVIDLPAPYGECGSRELPHFPVDTAYSPLKCRIDCLTSFLKTKCGCVQLYMSHNADVPVCTLVQNLECVKPNTDVFYSSGLLGKCDCPFPCSALRYNTFLSQASVSEQNLKNTAVNNANADPSDVNHAGQIQTWGTLNKLDPTITDQISEIAQTLLAVTTASQSLAAAFPDHEKGFLYLVDSTQQHGIQEIVESKTTKPGKMVYGPPTSSQPFIPYAKGVCNDANMNVNNIRSQAVEQIYGLTSGRSWSLEAMIADSLVRRKVLSLVRIRIILEILNTHFTTFASNLQIMLNYSSVMMQELENIQVLNVTVTKDISTITERLIGMKDRFREHMDTLYDQIREIQALPLNSILIQVNQPPHDSLLPDFYRQNQLQLQIYFQDLGVSEYRKSVAYSAEGLICDIGGSIGLCLGGSILTFIEILDIFIFSWFEKRAMKSDLELAKKEENKTTTTATQA